jgi:hypothetical protein
LQKPTEGKRSEKGKQNGKKELRKAQKARKAQTEHKISKLAQKLKMNTPP